MKKYYFTLVATLLAASVSAQKPLLKLHAQPSDTHVLSNKTKLPNSQKTALKLTGIGLPSYAQQSLRKAASINEIISEQPAGNLYKNQYQYAEGYYAFYGYIFSGYNDGSAVDYVVADDGNTVYLKNPISNFSTNSWIKGYKAKGDTIQFDFPQRIYAEQDGETTYNYDAYRMVFTVAETNQGQVKTYVPDQTSQTIKFVLRNDSLFKTDADALLGLGAEEDGAWTGYGDWTNDISKVNDTPSAPQKPEAAGQFLISYNVPDDDETVHFQKAKVAIEGNDVYLGGINPNQPDAWAKGKLEGDKVTFAKSYMGVDETTAAHTYFVPAGKEKAYMDLGDEEPYEYDSLYAEKSIVFDYDAKAQTLKSEGGFVVNKGLKDINQQVAYFKPSIASWVATPGTPDTPYIMDYMAFDPNYGYGGIQFGLNNTTKDGKYLDESKLYYNLWVDDELFTFYPDEYAEFTDEITDIPYSYNGTDIQAADDQRIIYFYVTGFEKMGIQEIYVDEDGTRYPSEIAWINADGTPTGVKSTFAKNGADVKSVVYTDLSGRRVAKPAQGIYVKTIKFSDGTVKNTKVVIK